MIIIFHYFLSKRWKVKWHDQIWDVSSRLVPGRVLAPRVTHEPVKIFWFKRLHQTPVIFPSPRRCSNLEFPKLGAGPDLVWDTDWAHRHPGYTRGGDERSIDALCAPWWTQWMIDMCITTQQEKESLSSSHHKSISSMFLEIHLVEFESHACNFYTFQLTLGYQISKHERTWFSCNFQFWIKLKTKNHDFQLLYEIKIMPIGGYS